MLYFHLPKNYWFPPITKDCEHNSWIYRIINPSITWSYGQQMSNSRVKTHYNQIAPFGPITVNHSSAKEKQLLLGDTCLVCSGQRFLDFLTQPEEQAVGSGVCAEGAGSALSAALPSGSSLTCYDQNVLSLAKLLKGPLTTFWSPRRWWPGHECGPDRSVHLHCVKAQSYLEARQVLSWPGTNGEKALQTCRKQSGGPGRSEWCLEKKWKDYITSCHSEITVSHWLTPNALRVVFL